ncbi:hypothetical protein BG842_25720 [Haladaptatus sp. W1]|nr:hypothetical protein BG842_25720 [Haladaptatus sp. W1]
MTGVGHRTDAVPLADKTSLPETRAARDAAAEAYEQAGITAADVDVAEVHDCFTGAEVLAIEALGLFEDGTGGRAAADGETYIDGEMPVNPSGGLKAKGLFGETGAVRRGSHRRRVGPLFRNRQLSGGSKPRKIIFLPIPVRFCMDDVELQKRLRRIEHRQYLILSLLVVPYLAELVGVWVAGLFAIVAGFAAFTIVVIHRLNDRNTAGG